MSHWALTVPGPGRRVEERTHLLLVFLVAYSRCTGGTFFLSLPPIVKDSSLQRDPRLVTAQAPDAGSSFSSVKVHRDSDHVCPPSLYSQCPAQGLPTVYDQEMCDQCRMKTFRLSSTVAPGPCCASW